MKKFWGYHLILDCAGCENVSHEPTFHAWITDLVNQIDMVAFGNPQILHFGHNDPCLAGWTVLQFIETSDIIAHFCDNTHEGYIDIFSCKPFNKEIAKSVVQHYFNPTSIRETYLVRQA